MRLSRWLGLIGILVAVGCLQVTWRNMMVLKGYAVGERLGRAHTQETDLLWLQAQVEGLSSPAHLARVAQEHRWQLVAWSTLSQAPGSEQDRSSQVSPNTLLNLAAIEPRKPATHESSD